MTENRIVVRWNPNDPTTIQEKAFLDRSISAAQRAGIRIVFSVYATEAGGISADPDARIALFTAHLEKLARTYPSVSGFIVGNEPNEAYFWQPQSRFRRSSALGRPLRAAARSVLRRVEGSQRVDHGGGSRALGRRQRHHLHLAGPLREGPGRRLPCERP